MLSLSPREKSTEREERAPPTALSLHSAGRGCSSERPCARLGSVFPLRPSLPGSPGGPLKSLPNVLSLGLERNPAEPPWCLGPPAAWVFSDVTLLEGEQQL